MRILCPTCSGKGSIPDPKLIGIPMNYSGPNGDGCPYVFCQTCSGSGWVASSEKPCVCHPDAPAVKEAPFKVLWPGGTNEGYLSQTPLANDGYRSQTLSPSNWTGSAVH